MSNVLSEYGTIVGVSASPTKADKVIGAIDGHLAGLDSNGNLTDSGISSTDIPNELADLTDDSEHRLVTDAEKTAWNTKSDFSGSYNDLTDKPILGSAAAKDVPASGDASSSQVVLGNDSRLSDARPANDVKAWAKADSKPSYTASEVGAIASTLKGANNGVAELDSAGKVPTSQLPSFVDDVIEYASTSAFPTTGESGKIYVALDTNKTYRWSGSEYVEISPSLALGETSATAYRGDRGKTAYDHATESGKVSAAVSSGLYKVAVTAQGHIASTAAVEKADITGLGIPGSDTKNTAGSTDTSSKIFLIGATSQAANPQTYSDNEVYATNGILTTKSVQVGGTAATMQYNSVTQSIDFIFA